VTKNLISVAGFTIIRFTDGAEVVYGPPCSRSTSSSVNCLGLCLRL